MGRSPGTNSKKGTMHDKHEEKSRGETMTDTSKDAGVIQVLVKRFEEYRLPRVLALKEKVDSGEPLNDMDIEYLKEVIDDAQQHKSLVDQHPEWQKISARVAGLYNEITRKALENEKGS
jgi:hypothetical protein